MSDEQEASSWWLASDGKWYPAELHPTFPVAPELQVTAGSTLGAPHSSVSPAGPQAAAGGVPGMSRKEVKQAEKEQRAAEEQERIRQDAEAQQAFWYAQSAVGRASAAREGRLPIFQWECDLFSSQLSSYGMSNSYVSRGNDASSLGNVSQANLDLAAIENAGWRLAAMSTVFIPHSEVSRDKALYTKETVIGGRVQAVYLFHPHPPYSD